MTSNGLVEHAAQCPAINSSGMHTEADDAPTVLVHDHQNPVSSQYRTEIDRCSIYCLSYGPGRSAMMGRSNLVPADGALREHGGPHPSRFRYRRPGRSARRFADNPTSDYAASSRRWHRPVPWMGPSVPSGAASAKTTIGTFVFAEFDGNPEWSTVGARWLYGSTAMDASIGRRCRR